MELASKYNPADVEGKWYQYWLDHKLFSSKPDGREPYTIVIPPPNVTGVLHMGHMLNNTIQDILVRRARMEGKNACWVPGTDHASIATEAKVVNKLAAQGIKKTDLSRDEFLKHAWAWTDEHGGIILKQLRKLGASCDWDRTAFTMDEKRSESVLKVFVDLYNKGLIYRGVRMVNWDPKALTALSDEEVIYKEEHGKLFYLRYKIEGEDLYLIGTSEHSMIGKFIGQTLEKDQVPQTLTSYSPCFRKEKGAHGIEERGVYRIHQFEKQEMIVVCEPEESKEWYEKLWKNTVDLFRSMDIPVRTLECCSGDLADLKVKSVDVEAWSPRQQKYFEVGSCSNLGDAQARRLGIRIKGENGSYFAHTLNNTVVAPPRMLIAFLENNLQADGSVRIPEVLQPYMGGNKEITPKNK